MMWLCVGRGVGLCWSRTVGRVCSRRKKWSYSGHNPGIVVIQLVLRRSRHEEVRLVVLLVRQLAFGKLGVLLVTTTYDQCKTSFLRAVNTHGRPLIGIPSRLLIRWGREEKFHGAAQRRATEPRRSCCSVSAQSGHSASVSRPGGAHWMVVTACLVRWLYILDRCLLCSSR